MVWALMHQAEKAAHGIGEKPRCKETVAGRACGGRGRPVHKRLAVQELLER